MPKLVLCAGQRRQPGLYVWVAAALFAPQPVAVQSTQGSEEDRRGMLAVPAALLWAMSYQAQCSEQAYPCVVTTVWENATPGCALLSSVC